MAARPNPHSALRLCTFLARNCAHRLQTSVERTRISLETNVRLTPSERDAYVKAIHVAETLIPLFHGIADTALPKVPKAPSERPVGRPSKADAAKSDALRQKYPLPPPAKGAGRRR